MDLKNLDYQMLYGKQINLKIDLLSFPQVDPRFFDEFKNFVHQLMTISQFQGVFQLDRVDSDMQMVANLDAHEQLEWKTLISFE